MHPHRAHRLPPALSCVMLALEGRGLIQQQGSVQKQGRFEVYEGDAMSPPQANGAALMEKNLAKPGTPDPNRWRILPMSSQSKVRACTHTAACTRLRTCAYARLIWASVRAISSSNARSSGGSYCCCMLFRTGLCTDGEGRLGIRVADQLKQ